MGALVGDGYSVPHFWWIAKMIIIIVALPLVYSTYSIEAAPLLPVDAHSISAHGSVSTGCRGVKEGRHFYLRE